ncbi:hypothetical protein [Bizionia myxarmorum]|uniref:Uncharacterized protein n=1 Tax=Bizionia myxarmorum TaxID=291186 RepID=A0A5D0RF98_9FLAO|nr:hypothetical protein [Bizionia myxarmorum]TYB79234.1 hypothetical protein ES674_05520 [Bizionia myxarmorum]
MKIKFLISSIIIFMLFQKDDIVGKYRDNFGSEYIFNSDYTYEYNASFHFKGFWSKGKWRVKNDTIYYEAIPSYHTLRIAGKKDSLILSRNKTAQLISANSYEEVFWPRSSGEQDVHKNKLFFKDGKLYKIKKNGKLITKKRTKSDRIDGEKFDPWFNKVHD